MITYKGQKIADKGVVINLQKRPERKISTDKLLSSLGFEGYEFVEGVVFEDPYWRQLNYGVTQAFLNCMKFVLDNNLNDLIIFEDDLKIMNGTTEEDFDNTFRNWNFHSNQYDIIGLGSRPLMGASIYKEHQNFGKVTNALCAHAYYYKKPFIEYFYEKLKNFNKPGDEYYKVVNDEFINDCCSHEILCKKYQKIFNVGITIPLLFSQTNGFSDGNNSEGDFDRFIENCYWHAIEKGKNTNLQN